MMIITDTASDIMESEAEEKHLKIAPLNILFGDVTIDRNTPENTQFFYDLLLNSGEFPQTSRPSPEIYMEYIEEAKARDEEVLILTLSSQISGTYESACLAAKLSEYPHVAVVDSKLAICAQRVLVEYALDLRDQGKTLAEAVPLVESFRERVRVLGYVDTLTYLRKGGRIPAPLAAIGNLLNIKPIIAISNGKLTSLQKTRSVKAAKKAVWKRMQEDVIDHTYPIVGLYANNPKPIEQWAEETKEVFGVDDIPLFQSMGVIAAHLGPDCAGFCYVVAEDKDAD